MRKIAIVLVLALFVNYVHSQGVEKQMGTSANASQIYFEVLGPGIAYSVNYDGRLNKIENGLGIRVGVSGAGGNGGGYFALPVQVNYLLGNNGQYLELGAGATYVSSAISLFDDRESSSSILPTATIGFRKQPFGKKGLTWRLAFTPFIVDGVFIPYGGASVGYRF